MDNIVDISKFFKSKIRQFGKSERKKIHVFIEAFHWGGFKAIDNFTIGEYNVRNKASIDVPSQDPQFSSKIKFAKKYKLWHFHAGFYDIDCDLPGYVISIKGDLTSQWVIFQLTRP